MTYRIAVILALLLIACKPKPKAPPILLADNRASDAIVFVDKSPQCSRVEWGPWKCDPNLRIVVIAQNKKWECFLLEEKRNGVWYESTTTTPTCSRTKPAFEQLMREPKETK